MIRVEDARLSSSDTDITVETTAHWQPHLATDYLVATWTKLHPRHGGKIKAIYTNDIMDQKEQSFPSWHSHLLESPEASVRASQSAPLVAFENPGVHTGGITTQSQFAQRGGLCCTELGRWLQVSALVHHHNSSSSCKILSHGQRLYYYVLQSGNF